VLVQTRYPDHPLFAALARHDFASFADSQLDERAARASRRSCSRQRCAPRRPKLDTAMRFLREPPRSPTRPRACASIDPVPHI
jgi:primosomal protein N' (replication factor Y)